LASTTAVAREPRESDRMVAVAAVESARSAEISFMVNERGAHSRFLTMI
jgi:hypothetical protein